MLLAYGFASMGRRVIIVDYDHSNKGATRRLADIAAGDQAPSAQTVYLKSEPPPPTIHRTRCDGLYYSTASKEMCLATFAGDASALRKYLDSLHTEFDVVVIDTPPLGLVTETMNVMPLSSYHLLVADWPSAR